jgi:long-subunit fatty acid transport protein
MRSALTQSGELRIGAEYRVKEWSLRGGYRLEQSPYRNQKTVGDLSTFSSGFGYNFGTTRLDVSYTFWKRNSENQFFSQGFTDSTKVNSNNNSVAVTLVFEL